MTVYNYYWYLLYAFDSYFGRACLTEAYSDAVVARAVAAAGDTK